MFKYIDELAASTGVQADMLKMAFALIASLLLSPLYRVFSGRIARNILSIVIGTAFLTFIIQWWALFILGSIVFPYLLCTSSRRPFLVSVICSFFLLLYVHGYRFIMIHSEWRVDCSVYIMLLVTKLTYFAKWLQKEEKRIKSNIIDYLGYNLFFPGVIAGPTFDYKLYLNFINGDKKASFSSLNFWKALQPFLISVPLITLTIVTVPYFYPRWVIENQFYQSLNIIFKILLLNFIGFFYRLKYYAGWYFAQGATNLSGLSENPSNGQYDLAVAVSIKFQTDFNVRNKVQYWNASNQQWLKNLVYDSLSDWGPNAAFFGTFLISAYWHGIYLTYYIGFILWGMEMHLAKWVYKLGLAYPKLASSPPVRIFIFVLSSSILNYIGMFMAILNWDNAIQFHLDVYHWASITLIVATVLSFIIKPPRVKDSKKGQKKE